MRRLLALTVVTLAVSGLTQVALAGTERYEAKDKEVVTPAPPPCTWTGFYIGGQAGFGGGDVSWKDTDFGDKEFIAHQEPSGVILGGQLGYNRQFGQYLVLGLEGEFAYSDISSGQLSSPNGDNDEQDTVHIRNNWTGNIGMRIGFTSMNNRLLVYGKGGAAFERWEYDWTHQENSQSNPPGEPPDTFGTKEWRVAPMVGFGLEYAITCHWSAKVEYKHLFLGTRTLSDTRIDGGSPEEESYDFENHQDSVTIGANYKF